MCIRDSSWTLEDRVEKADLIDSILTSWTRSRSKDVAALELQALGVAAGPVNTVPDMFDDSQVKARQFFVPFESDCTPMPGNPIKMNGIDPADWTRCPDLGEHNAEVLEQRLGYSQSQVEEYLEKGVLADCPPE